MGFGDSLIASGIARGAKARGKRIAFGDHKRILWRPEDFEIMGNNPNVALPGNEKADDLEWVEYYSGKRFYATATGGRWIFHEYQCPPGEVFFTQQELEAAHLLQPHNPFVVIEPRIKKAGASTGGNKQWPVDRYQFVADKLKFFGWQCVQLVPPGEPALLHSVQTIRTKNFRQALAVLSDAALYIGPEGGLHHGAAAVGTGAVVIWGGFNSPKSTGYPWHRNITDGGEPCGKIAACAHCVEAMKSISADRIVDEALAQLRSENAA